MLSTCSFATTGNTDEKVVVVVCPSSIYFPSFQGAPIFANTEEGRAKELEACWFYNIVLPAGKSEEAGVGEGV